MKLYALVAALGLLASAQTQTPRAPAPPAPPRADAPLPKAFVADQSGAPLTVTVPEMRWAGGGAILDVYIVVRNAGERPVTAYGTRAEYESARGEERCYSFNVLSPGKIIQQGQTDGRSRFHGVARGAEPKTVRVSLDFVEFADGTTWGPDICKTAERLAAERAGGRAVLEKLRLVLESEGPRAVVEAARNCEAKFCPPEDYEDELKEAYSTGVRTACWRAQRAYEQEGLTEIEATLRKPFDASAARP